VHALPPDLLACNTLGVGPGGCPTLAAPGDPLARPALDAPELLDVDVDELARPAAFVAVDRLGGSSRERLPSPSRLSTIETVESGMARRSEISAAVNRSWRSSQIAVTRSAGVLAGTRRGTGRRSTRPDAPWTRKRASHR